MGDLLTTIRKYIDLLEAKCVIFISGRVFARSAKDSVFEPLASHNFSPATNGSHHKTPTVEKWFSLYVLYVEGYRKFVDFPTGNS